MPDIRGRPTIRCLNEDLGIELPGLEVDLGELEHPLMRELCRIAPTSPQGQKRILSIKDPLVYRIRVSDFRGATWADEEHRIVWLCAAGRRQDGAEDDAFEWFGQLHQAGRLLPSEDDFLRDRAEAVTRLQRGLCAEIIELYDGANQKPGIEHRRDLGGWIPARMLVIDEAKVQEIWCALDRRGSDGRFVDERLIDLLFVTLEAYVRAATFEVRGDWPTGKLEWAEVVRYGIR